MVGRNVIGLFFVIYLVKSINAVDFEVPQHPKKVLHDKIAGNDIEKKSHDNMSGEQLDLNSYLEDFKKNVSECMRETKPKDAKQYQRLSPYPKSLILEKCVIACVLEKGGAIVHGKPNKENLLGLLKKFNAVTPEVFKRLQDQLDECINGSRNITNVCSMAEFLNQCTNRIMKPISL